MRERAKFSVKYVQETSWTNNLTKLCADREKLKLDSKYNFTDELKGPLGIKHIYILSVSSFRNGKLSEGAFFNSAKHKMNAF